MANPMTSSTLRYWCHMCDRYVDPIIDSEIKCEFCYSGFIEEANPNSDFEPASNPRSNRTLSLWAPILLGMMGPRADTGSGTSAATGIGTSMSNSRVYNDDNDNDDDDDDDDLDREFEDFIRRRRRRSAVRQLLQILREESEARSDPNRERNEDLERERTSLLINAFNQAILSQSSNPNSNSNNSNMGEDYFLGPGLDLLLQHLSENDPNQYGTPPAKKEAVQALPSVKIEDLNLNCSVCLDEFVIQSEAKMMPCKHKFHDKCILPWLELHSSCPVCRYQLPVDDAKGSTGGSSGIASGEEEASGNNNNNNNNNNNPWVVVPWPFNGLFRNHGDSSSGNGGNNNVNSEEN